MAAHSLVPLPVPSCHLSPAFPRLFSYHLQVLQLLFTLVWSIPQPRAILVQNPPR